MGVFSLSQAGFAGCYSRPHILFENNWSETVYISYQIVPKAGEEFIVKRTLPKDSSQKQTLDGSEIDKVTNINVGTVQTGEDEVVVGNKLAGKSFNIAKEECRPKWVAMKLKIKKNGTATFKTR